MTTPIRDFLQSYADKDVIRAHMPGHKGKLGKESLFDVTEISGADSLYDASGIIKQSEENASSLFGCNTFYSTEGSSHCIRAMMLLTMLYAKENGRSFRVLAGANAHKSFFSSMALLDFEADLIYGDSYLSASPDHKKIDEMLSENDYSVLYLTSPDYLGNTADIKSISDICRKHGVLLAVDNAHGSYLKFLQTSSHPIDLGADICCDSAHKTLPCLTGGAYLHISHNAPETLSSQAKNALAFFGTTSPSYLILKSLDECNLYLSKNAHKIASKAQKLEKIKASLRDKGYVTVGNEPLKLTVSTKPYGYDGRDFADILRQKGVEVDFADPDHTVLMISSESDDSELSLLTDILMSIEARPAFKGQAPTPKRAERVMSVREAILSPKEKIGVENSLGSILASESVGCPPAVPITICGERIDENAINAFKYYGINTIWVVK